MATEAFTVKAQPDIVHQIGSLADSLDRSRNYLVNLALKEYLETHAWKIERVIQGMAAADRGELVSHEDVMREIEYLIGGVK